MTQLILDGFILPESKKGGYKCYKETMSQDVTMITGRMVREVKGSVWVVEYQYGFFNDADRARLMEICERGLRQPISCSFLPQDSNKTLTSSEFFVTAFNRPKFMWSRDDKPLWADFSVTLREVAPND